MEIKNIECTRKLVVKHNSLSTVGMHHANTHHARINTYFAAAQHFEKFQRLGHSSHPHNFMEALSQRWSDSRDKTCLVLYSTVCQTNRLQTVGTTRTNGVSSACSVLSKLGFCATVCVIDTVQYCYHSHCTEENPLWLVVYSRHVLPSKKHFEFGQLNIPQYLNVALRLNRTKIPMHMF